MSDIIQGVKYTRPEVTVVQNTPLLVAELGGRTAYDSFDKSEHDVIRNYNYESNQELDADSSNLLDSLAWVHFHHSVLEHINISYLIKGTSRGCLQEISRTRIASYTVRSTRYTMSNLLNAFVASLAKVTLDKSLEYFTEKVLSFDMFVINDIDYNKLEIRTIFDKLIFQLDRSDYFINAIVAKSSLDFLENDNSDEIFNNLQNGKKKRNVGDSVKHIVTDNWKVDLMMTINLRSLKNFFTLRDSASAYFQIQWLAQEMKKVTPNKYLDLIVKKPKV